MTKIIALFLAVLMLCGLSAADAETEKEIPDVLGMTVGEGSLNFVENTEIVTYASDMYAFLLNLDGKYYRAIAFLDDDIAEVYEAMSKSGSQEGNDAYWDAVNGTRITVFEEITAQPLSNAYAAAPAVETTEASVEAGAEAEAAEPVEDPS